MRRTIFLVLLAISLLSATVYGTTTRTCNGVNVDEFCKDKCPDGTKGIYDRCGINGPECTCVPSATSSSPSMANGLVPTAFALVIVLLREMMQ